LGCGEQGEWVAFDYRYSVIIPNVQCNITYLLLEFPKAEEQMTAKPIIDYFQGV